ncbi:hypothetical protein ABBQ38_008132 [Trebouxia sp. C0009 RCD-2024]
MRAPANGPTHSQESAQQVPSPHQAQAINSHTPEHAQTQQAAAVMELAHHDYGVPAPSLLQPAVSTDMAASAAPSYAQADAAHAAAQKLVFGEGFAGSPKACKALPNTTALHQIPTACLQPHPGEVLEGPDVVIFLFDDNAHVSDKSNMCMVVIEEEDNHGTFENADSSIQAGVPGLLSGLTKVPCRGPQPLQHLLALASSSNMSCSSWSTSDTRGSDGDAAPASMALKHDPMPLPHHTAAHVISACPVSSTECKVMKLRTVARELLEKLAEVGQITVFTLGMRWYARAVTRMLDLDALLFGDRIISRADSNKSGRMTLQSACGKLLGSLTELLLPKVLNARPCKTWRGRDGTQCPAAGNERQGLQRRAFLLDAEKSLHA